jgi:iron complex outermembrane receptor protein
MKQQLGRRRASARRAWKFNGAQAVLLCAAAAVQAQTAQLPAVTVTASPVIEANRVDRFGSLATEVTEAQLRELNALDLASALRRTPGVVVSRFNPVGSFGGDEGGAVYVRGLGASRPGSEIKTYVDGIPFYMGVWNHPLLDLLPVHGMERISVYKGPQLQLFGNNFAAIDLMPRRATKDGLAAQGQLTAGSFSTVTEQAALQWRGNEFDVALAQGAARSSGHRDDADGKLSNVMGRAGYRLTPEWSLGLTLLYADNKVSDPGQESNPASKTGKFDTRGSLAALSVAHEHAWGRGSLQIYDNSGDGNWHDHPAQADTYSKFALGGLRWREVLAPTAADEVVLGADVDQSRGSVAFGGFTAFDNVKLRLTSPYAAISHTFALGSGWELVPSAGARWYHHDVFGNHTGAHGGLVAKSGETLALRVNVAQGHNFPGLDAALLNAIVPPLAGAPTSWRDLDPERTNHAEVGAHWVAMPGTTIDVALFNDRITGRYVFAFPPAVTQPSFTNLGDYSVKGAELSLQQQWGTQLALFAGLTLLDASRDDLPYAPSRALSLGATWRSGPWRISADGQAQGSMFTLNRARADGSANTEKVGGFLVANLRAAFSVPLLGPNGEVFAALENLGDRRYAVRPGYPLPGRSGQLGVSVGL